MESRWMRHKQPTKKAHQVSFTQTWRDCGRRTTDGYSAQMTERFTFLVLNEGIDPQPTSIREGPSFSLFLPWRKLKLRPHQPRQIPLRVRIQSPEDWCGLIRDSQEQDSPACVEARSYGKLRSQEEFTITLNSNEPITLTRGQIIADITMYPKA